MNKPPAQGTREVPARSIPVPDTVSPQMQELIARPHDPSFNVAPETAAEWKARVAKDACKKAAAVPALREALRGAVRATLETVRVTIPASDGKTVAEAYREGEVLSNEVVSGQVVLTARVPLAVAGRWREQGELVVERADAA